jgi:hypothetical protein
VQHQGLQDAALGPDGLLHKPSRQIRAPLMDRRAPWRWLGVRGAQRR